MKKLLLFGLLTACAELRHTGDVEATVHHKVSLDMEFIEEYCNLEHPDSETLYEECVAEQVDFFMEFIQKVGEQQ
jgi:hypothetical protein